MLLITYCISKVRGKWCDIFYHRVDVCLLGRSWSLKCLYSFISVNKRAFHLSFSLFLSSLSPRSTILEEEKAQQEERLRMEMRRQVTVSWDSGGSDEAPPKVNLHLTATMSSRFLIDCPLQKMQKNLAFHLYCICSKCQWVKLFNGETWRCLCYVIVFNVLGIFILPVSNGKKIQYTAYIWRFWIHHN